ncbi:unnamed protein product [Acanthoscelides obtectus]|nr:unnamed protein product [Acanthoscelides obtectus]CAK1669177.1 hypothetical protein AOBTE_LOCUS26852 [Acanthoscelides obtectus]
MVVLDTDYSSYHTSYQCNMEDPTRNTILVALRSTERDELLIKNQITKALKLVNITGSRCDSDQKECPNKLRAVKKYLS